ncbi:MAG: hypothetical protein FWF20_10275 [Betaproteobacteria bacterium]|nr:hypothetical protein [Betaproteobacteria bacterium]MCL2887143.1 hypothetical protein [Betaproteobacteria bacterium]
MDADLLRALKELDAVPDSAQKTQAIALIKEMQRNRERTYEALDQIEKKCALLAPSPRESRAYLIGGFLVGILALVALYSGFDAIAHAEYCSLGRWGKQYCTHGIKAQFEGVATVFVGGMLMALLFRAGRFKAITLWLFGVLGAMSFLASFLARLAVDA